MILQHIIRSTSDDHTASIFRYAFDDLLLLICAAIIAISVTLICS